MSGGEPIDRWCFFAYFFSTNAPSAPSCAGTAGEPRYQRTRRTLLMFGSAALTFSVLPNTRADPARSAETTTTPGALEAAAAAPELIGAKLLDASA